MSDAWGAERIEQMRQLAATGLSAAQIATKMNIPTSRSAVIGAANRHGVTLKGRPCPGGIRGVRNAQPRRILPRKPVQFRSPVEEAEPVVPTGESTVAYGQKANVVDVSGCRWPVEGEGFATMFCNAGRQEASQYCARHHRLARGR
jgi:hypothetical protein